MKVFGPILAVLLVLALALGGFVAYKKGLFSGLFPSKTQAAADSGKGKSVVEDKVVITTTGNAEIHFEGKAGCNVCPPDTPKSSEKGGEKKTEEVSSPAGSENRVVVEALGNSEVGFNGRSGCLDCPPKPAARPKVSKPPAPKPDCPPCPTPAAANDEFIVDEPPAERRVVRHRTHQRGGGSYARAEADPDTVAEAGTRGW